MNNHRKALASFAVYLLAAIFVSWPGISQLNTALIGRMGGDNYEHVWEAPVYTFAVCSALVRIFGSFRYLRKVSRRATHSSSVLS